jgi:succinate dehydrogenase/fumarate reductase flavoprotein subunit
VVVDEHGRASVPGLYAAGENAGGVHGAVPLLRRVNAYLRRWAGRKYKRLRTEKRYLKWLAGLRERQPRLLTHWRMVRTF